MSAYLTTTIKIKAPDVFRDYATKARETILAHGGDVLMVGKVTGALAGAADHHFEIVVRFADTAAIQGWYTSPEYQALIPLRDAGADVVFKTLEDM